MPIEPGILIYRVERSSLLPVNRYVMRNRGSDKTSIFMFIRNSSEKNRVSIGKHGSSYK